MAPLRKPCGHPAKHHAYQQDEEDDEEQRHADTAAHQLIGGGEWIEVDRDKLCIGQRKNDSIFRHESNIISREQVAFAYTNKHIGIFHCFGQSPISFFYCKFFATLAQVCSFLM